jgi:hypothetical protein
VPIVLGGIEASLRRIAHYDYWSDKVRRSILVDAKADLLLYGNAERAIVESGPPPGGARAHRNITDVRGTAFMRRRDPPEGWFEIDSTAWTSPARSKPHQPLPDHQRAGQAPDLQQRPSARPDGEGLARRVAAQPVPTSHAVRANPAPSSRCRRASAP